MRLKAPIKAVFFDAGWTLFRPANTEWFINNKMMACMDRRAFAAVPPDKKEAAFGRALRYLNENHLLTSDDEEFTQFRMFYTIIAENLPELALTREQIDAVAYSKVFDMENYPYFDDTVTTLEALKGGYKLGIISDTWPSIERILKAGGIDTFFDAKTYSYLLGVFKPDERMYLHALTQVGLPPEQTIFIDDSERNLDGAAKCGIQPVLITVNPDTKNSGKYPSISRLSDLLERLGR